MSHGDFQVFEGLGFFLALEVFSYVYSMYFMDRNVNRVALFVHSIPFVVFSSDI